MSDDGEDDKRVKPSRRDVESVLDEAADDFADHGEALDDKSWDKTVLDRAREQSEWLVKKIVDETGANPDDVKRTVDHALKEQWELKKQDRDKARLLSAKNDRLGRVSNILTKRRDLSVTCKHLGLTEAPSWWDETRRKIVLNQSVPPVEGDELRRLAYDKGMIYHEVAHVRWTRETSLRERLGNESKDPNLYADVSNILEDGRIEKRMVRKFPGTEPYLRYCAAGFIMGAKHPLGDLAFCVRFGEYVFEDHAKMFEPVQDLIDDAVASTSSRKVWRKSKEVVDKLVELYGGTKGGNELKLAGFKCFCHDPADWTDFGPVGDEPGDGDGGGDDGDGNRFGAGWRGGVPGEQDPTLAGMMEDVQRDIFESMRDDLKQEYEEMTAIEEVPPGLQEFRDGSEETGAEYIADLLKRMHIESLRPKWSPSKKTGQINSHRLTGIVTGDGGLRHRQSEPEWEFDCAILIDKSGSMRGEPIEVALSAARTLHGAMQKADIEDHVYLYTSGKQVCRDVENVPVDSSSIGGMGGTPTGRAIMEATEVLARSKNRRKLMMVITDGNANESVAELEAIRHEANRHGIHVVVIGIGRNLENQQLAAQANDWVVVDNTDFLADEMERVFVEFADEVV